MNFQEEKFATRISKSDKDTVSLINVLCDLSILDKSGVSKAVLEEDKQGIDFFIKFLCSPENVSSYNLNSLLDNFTDSKIPIQFKTRHSPGKKDIPVLRFQPFYGFDDQRTVIGRDYKSLKSMSNKLYFVGSKNQNKEYDVIGISNSLKLLRLILDAETEWFQKERPWEYLNSEVWNRHLDARQVNRRLKVATNGVEAWYKKNINENYGKINYYIPFEESDVVIKLFQK